MYTYKSHSSVSVTRQQATVRKGPLKTSNFWISLLYLKHGQMKEPTHFSFLPRYNHKIAEMDLPYKD